jgi:prolyl-tRNA editing enzyme YbaK/EbsC (Cys-tRNA(Pro) deacylase)
MTNQPLSSSAQKIQKVLQSFNLHYEITELPQATRTAEEAARAVGCQIGQIAKSLIFKTQETNKPILVITSGANRVSEEKIGDLIGEPIEKANPDFVREKTGFAIGGIPPVGHLESIKTFIDQDLMQYKEIWAAAGNPHAVFKLAPPDLTKITEGQVVSVS